MSGYGVALDSLKKIVCCTKTRPVNRKQFASVSMDFEMEQPNCFGAMFVGMVLSKNTYADHRKGRHEEQNKLSVLRCYVSLP